MVETRKAHELDIVELAEDLPKYGFKRGERATVISAFDDPHEAYDLEFIDESGNSEFAYSVRPEQIVNLSDAAREAFEQGIRFVKEGKPIDAERSFHQAIELNPVYIVTLHNFVMSFWDSKDWQMMISALRMVLRLDTGYEENGNTLATYARNNLAVAYQNYGVQLGSNGDTHQAVICFRQALGVAPTEETICLIRRNIAKAYTSLGVQAYENGDYELSTEFMHEACVADLNPDTRHNLRVSYLNLAKFYMTKQETKLVKAVLEYAVDTGLSIPGWQEYLTAIDNKELPEEIIKSLKIDEEFISASPMSLTPQQGFQPAA